MTADITILFKNSHLIHMERKQNRMHPKNDANSQHNCSGWSRQVHLRTHLETEQKPLRSDTLGLVGAHGVRLHSRYLQYRFVSSSWWSLNDPRRLLGQGFLLSLSTLHVTFCKRHHPDHRVRVMEKPRRVSGVYLATPPINSSISLRRAAQSPLTARAACCGQVPGLARA